MDKKACNSSSSSSSQDAEVRKGPWTMEEDLILINYIANHGEGVWNSLAKSAGLKRTGKSCRLRWLNYLRPNVRRGNITPEEQLLIIELHSKWGNRWSKIAKHLPGRTDNEIKNYWRTRVQKHIKQGGVGGGDPSNNSHGEQSSEGTADQANTSQVGYSSNNAGIDAMDTPYPLTASYPVTMHHVQPPTDHPNVLAPPDSNQENYWSMEDLWSMQLLNGE